MDLQTIRDEIRRLSVLVDGWSAAGEIPNVERDLALEKLRRLYETLRFADPAPGPSDEPIAADSRDGDLSESIDLGEVLSLDGFPDFGDPGESPEAPENPDEMPGEALENPEVPDEVPDKALENPEVPDEAPGSPEMPEMPVSDSTAEPALEPVSEPGFVPEAFAARIPDLDPERAFEPVSETAPESALDLEPVAERVPTPEFGSVSETAPASESASESGADLEPDPTPEFELETIPMSEPSVFEELDVVPESRPAPEAIPDPAPIPVAPPTVDPAPASTPAPDPVPTADPNASRHGTPTLFGPEDEAVVRHRHKQRVIMSLYDPNPTVETIPAAPRHSDARTVPHGGPTPMPGSSQPRVVPSPVVSQTPDPLAGAPIPEPPIFEVITSAAPESAEGRNADPAVPTSGISELPTPAAAMESIPDAASAFRMPAADVAGSGLPTLQGGAVLGEVINHDVQTLADTLARPRDMASELLRNEPVTDLRKALGLNDRFLLIRDLFGGDGEACERALDTLNGFEDLDDCMIFIAEHYAWNPNSDGAKLLMELLERKFA